MKKRVTKLAALALVAVMTVGTAVQASATTGNTAPTALTNVDSSIVTASAHRAATPLPEMLGANTIAGFGMINGNALTSSNALGNFALEVWGSATNNVTPDPYWCNYYWNFNGGSAAESVSLRNLPGQGSPVKADTLTNSADYGGVSISVYTRPDVLIGVSASNDVNDDTGYNDQLATIRQSYPNYNPKLVKYNSNTLDTMITTVKDAAEKMEATGKSYRYGDPTDIADDYANYIWGIKGYIKEVIGEDNYQTIAIVSAVNEDGKYTIQGQGSSSATSTNRYVEYTEDVTNNLTSQASENVSSSRLAQADVIILTATKDDGALENAVRADATVMNANPEIISMDNLDTLYGVSMNSVENALGMGYVLARIYDDKKDDLDVENVYKYFASKFYHIQSSRLDYIYDLAILDNVNNAERSDLISENDYDEEYLEGLFATYAELY